MTKEKSTRHFGVLTFLLLCAAIAGIVLLDDKPNSGEDLQFRDDWHPVLNPVDAGELYPLWVDAYIPLGEGLPPWPRGLTDAHIEVLSNADRIVVGRINPYPSKPTEVAERFHRRRVFGAIAIENPNDVAQCVQRLSEAIPETGPGCGEFYPEFGVRVWSDENVLDLLIQPECGMYAMTESEMRYCQSDPQAFRFLDELMVTIPEQMPDLEHR